MEEGPLNLAVAAFVAVVTLIMFRIWFLSARLRDALSGQDGHRLMVIFTRLFAVATITTAIGVARWIALAIDPNAEWFRQVTTYLSTTLFLAVNVWALLSVRAIIESGNLHE